MNEWTKQLFDIKGKIDDEMITFASDFRLIKCDFLFFRNSL